MAHLPINLYKQKSGYLYYRHPTTKKIIGLGRDQERAITEAIRLNELSTDRSGASRSIRLSMAERDFSVDSDGLVELQFLRENADLYARVCGIYFLLQDGEVVYVGQSINCHSRISDHSRLEHKEFDSVYIVRCDQEALTPLEDLYISKYSPRYNSSARKPTRKTAWGVYQRIEKQKQAPD